LISKKEREREREFTKEFLSLGLTVPAEVAGKGRRWVEAVEASLVFLST
jgi:hypothetical protein